jgi:CHAT domain-containing protein
VHALRCGLDRASWEGSGKSNCANLLSIDVGRAPNEGEQLPFDLGRAHELYEALFGEVGDLIKGKHLLIVPSGPLTQLPFQILITKKPDGAAGTDGLRRAAWLAKSNAITVLPSVSSLKALRELAKTSRAEKAMIGFGNPLLLGQQGTDRRAWEKQDCRQSGQQRVAIGAPAAMKLPLQRGGLIDVADIRALLPLPETADELCDVARDLRVPVGDIHIGSRATELAIKRSSESGELAAFRILHFATHGALAGEIKADAEPGLILTPPDVATAEDDGYLSASEIAGLNLNADWVILSACNTAASGANSAEALSGMARAFFYAGARALLVSHWAVNSESTVKLIKGTLNNLSANNSLGRAEALRRSMLSLIENGAAHEAHPAYWAPFVVVGEGGSANSGNSPPVAAVSTRKTVGKPRRQDTKDWATEFLSQRN